MKSMLTALHTHQTQKTNHGFTLIEVIILVMVVGIASTGILSWFQQMSSTLLVDEQVQSGAYLVQECTESIVGLRRNPAVGYAGINNTTCDTLPVFSGYTRAVTITDPYTGGTACAVGATCKQVDVSVLKAGNTVSAMTLMLVDY